MTAETDPTYLRLINLANKLQMLWGNSPDVQLLHDAAEMLKPEPKPEPKTSGRTKKKKD